MNMEKLTLRETQLAEFDVLCALVDFLDNQHLQYMLAYGTLLGAIRHKGFIPWDDDIDIEMPREDYEKLKQIVKDGKFTSNKYIIRLPGDKGYQYPFIKAGTMEYIAEDTTFADGFNQYLWVDIFPVDNFPASKKKCDIFANILLFRMRTLQFNSHKIKKVTFKRLAFWCYSKLAVALFGGYANYAKHIDRAAYKLGKKNAGSGMVGQGVWEETHDFYNTYSMFPAKKDESFPFEGRVFNIPADYDATLKEAYGDYMQLPPIDKRPTHGITVYKNPEFKEEK